MAPAESARGKYVKNDRIYNKIDLCRKAQKKKIRRWEKNTDWTAEAVKLLLFDKKLTNRQKFTAENRKIYDPTKKMENVLKKIEKSNKAREKGICKKCTNPKCKLQRIKQA